MKKLDKVIAGLEQCHGRDCDRCGYASAGSECERCLMEDALSVIREMEQKYRDYEPVVHAHWIFWWEDGVKRCKCSECLTSYGCLDTPRCLNCGAHMDEEVVDV